MKKLSIIVAMALAAVINYSCGEYDNAVNNSKTVFVDENGNKYETDLVATFLAAPGSEVILGVCVADETDHFVATSGGYQSPVTELNNAKRTDINVTVGDDGIIKLYGNSDIKQLFISGGAVPTAFDLPKLANIEWLRINGAEIETVKLPALEKLTYLNLNKCIGLTNIDLSEAKALETLLIQQSVDPKFTSIDLSNNSELKVVRIGGKNNANNELTSMDLTKNYQLQEINLAYNKLQSLKLASSYENLEILSLTDNQLTELNLDGYYPKLASITVNKNQLTSIDVSKVSALTTLNCANNKLNFATVPLNATTYGNQADYETTTVNGILDLTDQALVDGTETVFTFDRELKEGTDYDVITNGKYRFLKAQTGLVVTMTNAALPKLTLNTIALDIDKNDGRIFEVIANGTPNPYCFGGTVVSVPAVNQNLGYNEKSFDCIRITGTEETIADDTDYIRVDLEEPLRLGEKIFFTGFRHEFNKDNAAVKLYVLFDLLNDDNARLYKTYLPKDEDTFTFTNLGMSQNIWDNDVKLVPDTQVLLVDEALAGSKSFKIARTANTTFIYLTKINIMRW
jgi:hypothetical protein